MIAPLFVTAAEIMTFGNLAVLKFYYHEPDIDDKPPDKLKNYPVASVIMPRKAIVEIAKRMTRFLAVQEEHMIGPICRHCVKYRTEECPMRNDTILDVEMDGCSRFELKPKEVDHNEDVI